jgi:hypothetical protein
MNEWQSPTSQEPPGKKRQKNICPMVIRAPFEHHPFIEREKFKRSEISKQFGDHHERRKHHGRRTRRLIQATQRKTDSTINVKMKKGENIMGVVLGD